MKKNIKNLLYLGTIILLLTGCSNKSQVELCDNIRKINIEIAPGDIHYESLSNKLSNNYNKYCKNPESSVCKSLKDAIDATNKEVEQKDCSGYVNESWKNICEIDNNLAVKDKGLNVTDKILIIISECRENNS